MTERRPRPSPPRESLDRAIAAQKAYTAAVEARPLAFLAAFNDGWTVREIGEAVDLTHPAVIAQMKRQPGQRIGRPRKRASVSAGGPATESDEP